MFPLIVSPFLFFILMVQMPFNCPPQYLIEQCRCDIKLKTIECNASANLDSVFNNISASPFLKKYKKFSVKDNLNECRINYLAPNVFKKVTFEEVCIIINYCVKFNYLYFILIFFNFCRLK